MFRSITVALLLVSAATATYGQTPGGPPIAYVKRVSNGDEIYLVNRDGTGPIRVYKAPSKVQITMLDLRPGGGEIAFLEGYTKLKIMAFDSYGRTAQDDPRTIRTVSSPCTVESPDYHPSNGTLLFVEGCGRDRAVRTVQPGAKSAHASPLFANVAVFRARWSRLGDTIYYIGLRHDATSSDPTYLYRRAGTAAAEELGVLNSWSTFDVARVGDKLFWNLDNGSFKMLDVSVTSATTADAVLLACPSGSRLTRSSDDSEMVYQSPSIRGKGNYVMLGPTNCGDPRALTGQGSWGWLDWRTDVTPSTTP